MSDEERGPMDVAVDLAADVAAAVADPATRLRDFMESDAGQRAAAHLQQQTIGPLMVPAVLLEDVIMQQLRSNLVRAVQGNIMHYLRYFSGRAILASCLLQWSKLMAKRTARRLANRRPGRVGKIVHGAVDFVCDVALPTNFFGPVLGVTFGILELAGIVNVHPTDAIATLMGVEDAGGGGSGAGGGGGSTVSGEVTESLVMSGEAGGSTGGAFRPRARLFRDTGSLMASVLGQTNPMAASMPTIQSDTAAAKFIGAVVGLPTISVEKVESLAHIKPPSTSSE